MRTQTNKRKTNSRCKTLKTTTKSSSVVLDNSIVNTSSIASIRENSGTAIVSMTSKYRARKSFPSSLQQNLIQHIQAIDENLRESMYKAQIERAIEHLTANMQMNFTENLQQFIAATENQFRNELCKNELADMKKRHEKEVAGLKAEYEEKLKQCKREHNEAVEDAKMKQWCRGCGKGTKHKMMIFCNSKCQKMHMYERSQSLTNHSQQAF